MVTRRRRRAKPGLIGEHATLLGAIAPLGPGETVPLIADDREDFGVVKKLLTEHYAAFEKGWFEVAYDDTDPTWRDFLFGALLREIGTIVRGDSLAATIWLTIQSRQTRMGGLGRRLTGLVAAFAARFLSRYPVALGDAYAALNHGRDHLVQFLAFLKNGREEDLSAHADASRLLKRAHDLLKDVVRQEPAAEDLHIFRATLHNRLAWLSRQFYAPLAPGRRSRLGLLVAGLILAGLGVLVAFAVREAIQFHPIFIERMLDSQPGSADDVPTQ